MFTVTIYLQISFDKENQVHSKELAQLVNEELKQSVQSIQNKYNQIKIPPNSSVEENSQTNFFDFADHEANELELNRRYNTSRNYRTAIKRLREYTESTVLPFNHITVQFIDNFESFLKKRACSLNTISCYMRSLRAIYNKAVNQQLVIQQLPFNNVFTGTETTRKRAVSCMLIRKLTQLDCTSNPAMQLTKDIFLFSFYTRGISFIDIAYMQYSHIKNGYLKYQRSKTHQSLSVRLEIPAYKIIKRYRGTSRAGYLFPILTSTEAEQCYKEYRYQLGLYNKRLNRIGMLLGLKCNLSSYVSRHTWATLAREYGIPLSIISEGLGHTSERTTRIYIKHLDKQQIDKANHKLLCKTLCTPEQE